MSHRIFSGSKGALLLALAAAPLGCSDGFDPSTRDEPVASVASATTGFITFDNASCRPFGTNILENNLRTGLALARFQLDNPLLTACMENAFLALNNHSYAERFLARMRDPVNTVVRCEDLSHVESAMWAPPREEWPADLPAGTEEFVLADFGFAAGGTPAGIAALFLHEVSHNKGFGHPNQEHDSSALDFRDAAEHRSAFPRSSRPVRSPCRPAARRCPTASAVMSFRNPPRCRNF
jgi:hypothetical protein